MDDMFWLVAFGVAVAGPVAFFMALGARERLAAAERRIAALEAQLRAAGLLHAASQPDAPAHEAKRAVAAAPEEPPRVEATAASAAAQPRIAEAPPTPPPSAPPRHVEEAPSRGLEERLVTRWTVWVGGVALALGGLLLVRYSIEQGFFGPAARCLSGFLFGAALAAAGEWLRRREKTSGAPTQTPAILTAAGTVAVFGAIYAAHGLYGFIGSASAFAALAGVALAAILAAVLHGPWLAGLGLLGAGVAPLLVATAEPSPWPVVLHLAVVAAAAHTLAQLRGWFWLAAAAAGLGALWAVVLGAENSAEFVHAGLTQALLSFVLAAGFVAFPRHAFARDAAVWLDWKASAVVGVFAVAACLAMGEAATRGGFDLPTLFLAGALALGLAALGARLAPVAVLTLAAGVFSLFVLLVWPDADFKPMHAAAVFALPEPLEPARFAIFAAFGAALAMGLGALRLAVGRVLPPAPAQLYAIAAAAPPLAILALAELRLAQGQKSAGFAVAAAMLALGFALLAQHFRGGAQAAAARLALGAFATAALAALALGLVFALDKGMLTVALALAGLAAAAVSARLGVGALRFASAAMGFVVLARLVWDPRIVGGELGTTPIFNWLSFGYGVPALAFAGAAWLMRRVGGEDLPVRLAQALSILFAAFLVFFEIRHALNGGDPFALSSGLVEQGLFATSALLFSLTLTRLDMTRASPVLGAASYGFGAISVGVAASALAFLANPYLNCRPIEGGALLNGLLLGYAAPALCAALLMRAARGLRPLWFTTGAGALSIALLFLYACLETRRLFHDSDICASRASGDMEIWAYSAVWLGLGVLLLIYGIARGVQGARLASALFVLAAALKIFLYDLSDLEGLMRALSFIGLGVVLIGIGLIYQKLVFRGRAPPAIGAKTDAAPGSS